MTISEKNFDFESFKKEAIEKLKAGKGLTGAEGAFTPLLKNILEELLKGEVEEHLRESDQPNQKMEKG